MNIMISAPSPRTAALRVFGATGVLFAGLVTVLVAARPEMVMSAMQSAMHLIFVP